MEKDYSLLRPFDLEAARRGDPVQYNSTSDRITYLAGPDPKGNIAYQRNGMVYVAHANAFKMAPLAWAEGRPVYRGDVLYSTFGLHKGTAIIPNGLPVFKSDSGEFIPIEFNCSDTACSDTACAQTYGLTWQKPKTKREGWVNIYEKHHACWRYDTKEEADRMATLASDGIDPTRVACIYGTWEE